MPPNFEKMCKSGLWEFSTQEEGNLAVLLDLCARKRKTLSSYDNWSKLTKMAFCEAMTVLDLRRRVSISDAYPL